MTTTYRVLEQSTSPYQQQVKALQNNVPVSPAAGDRYIVTATASGAWVGKETDVAWYDGSVWKFDVPAAGWQAYNNADGFIYKFSGSAWAADDSISNKADKVAGSPNGYLAGLDSSGNLTNSAITETSVTTAISLAANAATAASVATAISEEHVQGTDQGLDTGGPNAVTVSQVKEAYGREAQYDSTLKCLKFTI